MSQDFLRYQKLAFQMPNRLVNIGYITKSPYGSINITDLGIKKAKEVYKRHTLIKSFLVDILGVNENSGA